MIEARFNIDEIISKAEEEAEALLDDIIIAMQQACMDVVKMARELPSPPVIQREEPHQPNYIDNTGYLRGSIGYALYNNGTLVVEDYQGSGQEAAKKTADEVAAQYSDGIVAVIVAGADYAAAVESKGYDVLTGSAKQLKNIFKGYLEDVKQVHGL
jgi:DNA-binding protein YbaB